MARCLRRRWCRTRGMGDNCASASCKGTATRRMAWRLQLRVWQSKQQRCTLGHGKGMRGSAISAMRIQRRSSSAQ